MKRLKTLLCILGLSLTSSLSFAGEMDVLFGNTVVLTTITPESETTIQLYYNPDGSVGTDTDDVYTWQQKGDAICTVFKLADGSDYEACAPLAEMKGAGPGSTWETQGGPNMTIKGKLVAGR